MNTNLDALTLAELKAFWVRYQLGTSGKIVSQLFDFDPAMPKPKGYMGVAGDLASYALNRSIAITCRERGDIETALAYEGICDRIFDGLPDYAIW